MKTVLFGLALFAITSCKTDQANSSEVESAGSKSLASRLSKVACVENVAPETRVGTPETPVASTATGNLIVTVKNPAKTANCVEDLQKAIRDIQILSVAKSGGLILVLGDAKQLSVNDKIKRTNCAEYVEAETIIGTPENNSPVRSTGNLIVKIKNDLDFHACVDKLKANGVSILSTIDGMNMILVKGN